MVEVTYRTIQGRFLLRPEQALNELVIGVLARAQSLCPRVGLVGIVVLSNHILCAAAHKRCYVECRIMWSWRRGSRGGGTRTGLSSA